MSLRNYWPTKEFIAQCIRTEAEELAEHTLLAVHEPMQLLRKGAAEDINLTEQDLLEHFLTIERPIPIIGRSGVGKSHLIRWIDAQLRLREESKDWHVVRIPKNASLRQVLDLLLQGLDGEVFEQARSQINSVGQKLDTREVADHLLVFMGHQLRKIYHDAKKKLDEYRASGIIPGDEEKNRLRKIMLHAGDEVGLSALINDVDFKLNLLKPSHCIYQFASRLTKGATDDELSENDYQIHADDLNFSFNLSDLASSARRYVQQAQLNTNERAREDAVSVLNEVLGDATREAFHHIFQFNGGSFQDLFKDIRRYLKGRTLVVLVEDMAAISAIEDVLIDSLLEEGIRDGDEVLCPLRSAIAVTDGYPGYVRRQGTIKTRARFEWWIQEKIGDEEQTEARIVDFCSRYLNAARHGSNALYQLWKGRTEDPWPPVWHDENVDHKKLDSFGTAVGTGVPLFPFNRAAILALSDKFCRDSTGHLQFNPREVLNQILLSILRDCRDDYENDRFPPTDLAGIKASGSLRNSLYALGLVDPNRAETLAAIWGYGARTLDELKANLSADVALSFNLSDLARYLKSGVNEKTPRLHPPLETNKPKVPVTTPDPDALVLEEIELTIDQWFQKKKELGQNEARLLRSKLDEMYQLYARNEWKGLRDLPSLKVGPRTIIYLPNAMGNPATKDISFCSDKDFSNSQDSLELIAVTLAIFRYEHYNSKDKSIGWSYPQGFEDFTKYQNFASNWVPATLQTLTALARLEFTKKFSEHVQSAWVLGIFRETDKHIDRINKLLIKSEDLKNKLPVALASTVQKVWDQQLDQWDQLRSGWLDLIASNDHAMQGDLAMSAIGDAMKSPPNRTLIQSRDLVFQELNQKSQLFQLLSDCENVEAFNSNLEALINLIRKLQKTGNYPTVDGLIGSKTVIEKIQLLITESSPWLNVKNFMTLFESGDVVRQWQLINQIDGRVILALSIILDSWKFIFNNSLPKLKNQNAAWGAEQLISSKQLIDDVLVNMKREISDLGVGNEHA